MQPFAEPPSDGVDAPPQLVLFVQVVRQVDHRSRSLQVWRRRMGRRWDAQQQGKDPERKYPDGCGGGTVKVARQS